MSLIMVHGLSSGTTARELSWGRSLKRLAVRTERYLRSASRWIARRRARRELLTMPDYMLADIGISRSEVESAVRYGRPDPRFTRGRL